jgi:ABC-type transporter Mla subunit MlaD
LTVGVKSVHKSLRRRFAPNSPAEQSSGVFEFPAMTAQLLAIILIVAGAGLLGHALGCIATMETPMSALTDALSQLATVTDAAVTKLNSVNADASAKDRQITELTSQVNDLTAENNAAAATLNEKIGALNTALAG